MDPRDHPRPLLDGATCTACGAPVPTGRIRILARRDDLAFVELDCPACRSVALGLLLNASEADAPAFLDVTSDPPGGAGRPAGPRSTFRPISAADVSAIRGDLAAWDGDLVGWLDAIERGDRRGSVVDG
jgi:hypothetical protein